MNEEFIYRLEGLLERYNEITEMLSDPEIIQDQKKYTKLSKEYKQLEELVLSYNNFKNINNEIEDAELLLQNEDHEIVKLAKDDISSLQKNKEILLDQIKLLLIPEDLDDEKNVFLEIRAGTGGDEAAIFVGDLFKMYSRYAEQCRWKLEIVHSHTSEYGGFKEIVARVTGNKVYAKLKFESGTHRVQRIPDTESQGRIHTSACTVAIMTEAEEIDDLNIKSDEIRIDTYRASGAGGQHVNKTDSAVRITHIPSGIVVECQDERSQHKNKAKALSLLEAKILSQQKEEVRLSQEETRRSLIGSGDRSDRIRTYNYPQNRLTDHRVNLTLYKLDQILQGDVSLVNEVLIREDKMEKLANLTKE